MWLKREISDLLVQLAAKRPAVLITGARQTGKTSLLQQLFTQHNYVTLDIPLNARRARDESGFFLENHATPLIIDEIQYAPELFRYLKVHIDQNRHSNGQFLITGSQKFSLMQGVTDSLAGRVSIVNLHSLSVAELHRHFDAALNTRQTLQWMVKGGYPEIYEHDLESSRFHADYIATYIERDVRQLINIRHVGEFDQFMRLLALRSGQIFNMSRIASEVGVSVNTIKSWINVLETSNIIYLLRPYYQNFGKRLIKSPKLYFLDTGLLCYLTNIHSPEMLVDSPLLGAFFETFALGQLLRKMHNRGAPDEIYYFRDKDGKEVDFLIPWGSQIDLYECKWNDETGEIPTNIKKLLPVFGQEHVRKIHTLTNTEVKVQISDKFFVSNMVEL